MSSGSALRGLEAKVSADRFVGFPGFLDAAAPPLHLADIAVPTQDITVPVWRTPTSLHD
jgi:hypothetical protein